MTSTTVQLLSGLRNMSIKVYPTEVEAVDEDSKSRVFVIKLETPDVFSMSIDTLRSERGTLTGSGEFKATDFELEGFVESPVSTIRPTLL